MKIAQVQRQAKVLPYTVSAPMTLKGLKASMARKEKLYQVSKVSNYEKRKIHSVDILLGLAPIPGLTEVDKEVIKNRIRRKYLKSLQSAKDVSELTNVYFEYEEPKITLLNTIKSKVYKFFMSAMYGEK